MQKAKSKNKTKIQKHFTFIHKKSFKRKQILMPFKIQEGNFSEYKRLFLKSLFSEGKKFAIYHGRGVSLVFA